MPMGTKFGDGPNWRIRVVRAGLEAIWLASDQYLDMESRGRYT